MKKIVGKVVSVHVGAEDMLAKEPCSSLTAMLDGFVGDRHRSYTRTCWQGDKQAEGTVRRNERQWSAVSVEELTEITEAMDLTEPLTATTLGANICFSGIPKLSDLPQGTTITFPSGAELMVEEFNPPCLEMGEKIASQHATKSGKALRDTDFSKAAQYTRGVVGVIEVAGALKMDDEVIVKIMTTEGAN